LAKDARAGDPIAIEGALVALPGLSSIELDRTAQNAFNVTPVAAKVTARPSAKEVDAEKSERVADIEALVGGIVLSAVLANKTGGAIRNPKRDTRPFVLSTFDLLADRFDPVNAAPDPADLPCAMPADDLPVDWIVMN
jgi:hypothetical protein